jgi:hypothetical protein
MSGHIPSSVSRSWCILRAKEKPTARLLLAVGSVDSFKSALLHPIPSSRRHVIRVDIPVPVDVIRVDFWMEVFIRKSNLSVSGERARWKFKLSIAGIRISDEA